MSWEAITALVSAVVVLCLTVFWQDSDIRRLREELRRQEERSPKPQVSNGRGL